MILSAAANFQAFILGSSATFVKTETPIARKVLLSEHTFPRLLCSFKHHQPLNSVTLLFKNWYSVNGRKVGDTMKGDLYGSDLNLLFNFYPEICR